MKLNLGAGPYPMKGWINCDLTYTGQDHMEDMAFCDARRPLPWDSESLDEVYMGHFLEHLTDAEGKECLKETRRILRPGGKLTIITPDMRSASGLCLKGHISARQFFGEFALGFQNWRECQEGMEKNLPSPHKNVFDLDLLFSALIEAGFIGVCPIDIETSPLVVSRFPIQIGFTCVKSRK